MGCGKSKHDVASDNVLQRKKSSASSMAGQENVTETKDTNNNNVADSVSNSEVQAEQKESGNVREFGVEAGKDDEVVNDVKGEEAEKINVEEKKAEAEGGEGKTEKTIVGEEQPEKSEEGEKDDSSKENEQKTNDDDTDATEEKVQEQNENEDVVSMKKEDSIKDLNV